MDHTSRKRHLGSANQVGAEIAPDGNLHQCRLCMGGGLLEVTRGKKISGKGLLNAAFLVFGE